jgi:phage repressor protein C with HTH and peptisase S24 domain
MPVTAERLEKAMESRGYDQSGLARAIGVSQATINRIVQGKTANSRLMPRIATKLGVPLPWLLGMSDDMRLDLLPPDNDDDAVEIDTIDLAYGMGGTFVDDTNVQVEKARFSRSWLRLFTDTAPDHLFSTQGVGDSMYPTIHDRDVLIIDRSQRSLADQMSDKVWAVMFGEVGMIKRLRPMPDGTVKILSDNPSIPPEVATDGDLFIVGRVVAKVSRM